jgi:poly-gamma-glutamate capsule biosynthesis protein CapA/YwtB (metallophosphatase superfamily)
MNKSQTLKRLTIFVFCIIFLSTCGTKVNAGQLLSDTSHLTLLFAGDIMGHDTQISAAYYNETGTYDYSFCFSELKPTIQKADISIGNLEVTLAGEPYKGYPKFSSPDELVTALKDAGFDILINANNHALDRGKEGLERTIDIARQKGLIMTGTFKSNEDREISYPLVVEKNNILLGILNYTYGTNGLISSPPNIVNYIDTSSIRNDIQKIKKVNPDFIIACVHWGNEYEPEGNNSQRSLARFLANEGVDAIIGSHPHVVQPFEILYSGTDSTDIVPVVYSLGNFISNQRERYRNGGIIFVLELTKTDRTKPTSFSYMPVWVQKPVINEITRFRLIPANIDEKEMDRLALTKEELIKLDEFFNDTHQKLLNVKEYHVDATDH